MTLPSFMKHVRTLESNGLIRTVKSGALKTRPGRELQIHGSARLGKTLLSAGLVDTLRLVVAPTVIGDGRRLLEHPSEPLGLQLTAHDVTAKGLLLLEYTYTGQAPQAEYEGATAFA
jgi:dihydrofolate reductase